MNTNQRRDVSMGFSDQKFPAGTHMCLIYDDDEERRGLVMPTRRFDETVETAAQTARRESGGQR